MSSLAKKNYSMLDLGKFLCALLILFYHYFSEHPCLPSILEEALSLYAVGVALFMVISGFLTFEKLETIEGTAARWQCVKKQVLRILKIYALWSIPYLIYTVFCEWERAEITLTFVLAQVRQWIFGSTFYTIWFMPSLAVGLVLAFWIKEKLPKAVSYLLMVLLYLLGALTDTYRFAGDAIPGFSYIAEFSNVWLGGSRGWLFYGSSLTMLGSLMVGIKDKIRWQRMLPLSMVSLVLLLGEALVLRHFVGHTGIDLAMMMGPTVFCILGFLLSTKLPEGGYLVWMRKMSVLIFITQRLFLTVLPDILPQAVNDVIFANNYVGAVIICGGTIGLSAALIALSKKIKWLKNLY